VSRTASGRSLIRPLRPRGRPHRPPTRRRASTSGSRRRSTPPGAAAGADTEHLDLREYELPVYDADDGDAGDAVQFRTNVREADGVVLGTPVYHGTYTSALKAALDYCGCSA
jgi:NAD(P)H-dependent FMN reductase